MDNLNKEEKDFLVKALDHYWEENNKNHVENKDEWIMTFNIKRKIEIVEPVIDFNIYERTLITFLGLLREGYSTIECYSVDKLWDFLISSPFSNKKLILSTFTENHKEDVKTFLKFVKTLVNETDVLTDEYIKELLIKSKQIC